MRALKTFEIETSLADFKAFSLECQRQGNSWTFEQIVMVWSAVRADMRQRQIAMALGDIASVLEGGNIPGR